MYIRSYVCMCVLKCVLRAAITLRILWALHALTYCPVVKFILALTRAATCMNARGAAKQWQGRRQSLFAVYTQIYICNEACWVTSVKALGGGGNGRHVYGSCVFFVLCFPDLNIQMYFLRGSVVRNNIFNYIFFRKFLNKKIFLLGLLFDNILYFQFESIFIRKNFLKVLCIFWR